jgi:hypothetical protein
MVIYELALLALGVAINVIFLCGPATVRGRAIVAPYPHLQFSFNHAPLEAVNEQAVAALKAIAFALRPLSPIAFINLRELARHTLFSLFIFW